MNELFSLHLTKKELQKIGVSLGADVVPCMQNGLIKATGIGEIIEKVDASCKLYFLVIKPEMSCNTGKMYQKIDENVKMKEDTHTQKMIKALKECNLYKISKNLYNVFEEVVDEKEHLKQIKEELLKCGALGTLLAGSGSCVYGLFKNKKSVKKAYYKLKKVYNTYFCISFGGEANVS